MHAAEPVLVREREGVQEHVLGVPPPGEHRRADRRQQVRVRERHALGSTGRPRGERQYGGGRTRDLDRVERLTRRLGLGQARTGVGVQGHHRPSIGGERSKRRARGPAGERSDGVGDRGDPRELGPGERRGQGNGGGPDPERREVRHDEREGVRGAEQHPVSRFDPVRSQPSSDPGRPVVQVAVASRGAVDRQRGRIRASVGRLAERRRQRSGAERREQPVVHLPPEVRLPRRRSGPCDRPVGERVRHRRGGERGASPPGSLPTTSTGCPAVRVAGPREGRPR